MKLALTTIIFILIVAISLAAQTRQTDRQFDGFKGSVQSVVTERSDLKKVAGKQVESTRRPESSITYDKNGNRLTWKTYGETSGLLFESVIYKQLDGDKVSVYEKVDSPDILYTVADSAGKPIKPSDPRYTYKLKYKYDANGKVSEEAWWQSDGDLWIRYVYVIKGNQREELTYEGDGSLNEKYIFTIDPKGNDIEMVSYDPETNKVESKGKYEYLQFDGNSNWTKRIEWGADEESKFVLKPREVEYRTFTYYP